MAGLAIAFGTICLVAVLVLLPEHGTIETADGVGGPSESALPERAPAMLAVAECEPVAEDEYALVIRRNETFYEAMSRIEAPHTDIMALVDACKPFRNLRSIRTGEVFRLLQAEDGGVRSLSFDLDEESYLVFAREGDTYEVRERTYPVERRVCGVSGTIDLSLYESLQTAGAPVSLASKINDILGWEIDFRRDLRKGDSFRILYEEMWKDGELVRTGSVLGIECVNRGESHRAYRFEDADGRPGYYNPEGANFQKQLSRAPLNYSRISSKFSYRRFHPVLKRWMPHLGVDYAAPVGTPVRAAGDGTVVEATRKKGNGRFLHIRHTNRSYETYYLHLSRYAKGIKKGSRVRQGEVIGYVGATGYATGPHLDFRVKKDGTFVNPRTLKLPPAAPVCAESRPLFDLQAELYDRALTCLEPAQTPVEVVVGRPVLPPLRQPDPASNPLALGAMLTSGE